MMLKDQIYAQALLLAGELDAAQTELLRILSDAAASSLAARLKDGLTPDDCEADFVAAASLYALAALGSADENIQVEEFKAGDLTVKQAATTRDAASRALQRQADLLMLPYLKDRFSFMGV